MISKSQWNHSLPEFGTEYARSMLANHTNVRGANDIDYYIALISVMQGRQPSSDLWNSIGYSPGSPELGAQGIARIDPRVLNLAPKFINIIKSKITEIEYDINVDAIDAISLDDKKQFEVAMRTAVTLKSFYEGFGVKMREMFPDIPEEQLPNSIEDLEINTLVNYKAKDSMDMEIYLKQVFNVNNWNQIADDLGFDLPVLGKGIVLVYMDHNGHEKLKRINPLRFISSFSETGAFDALEYAGHIEYITEREFRMESTGVLSVEKQDEIIASSGSRYAHDAYSGTMTMDGRQDGQIYIPVLRYQFLVNETDYYVEATNAYGNKQVKKKKQGFTISEKEMPLYQSGVKTLITDSNICRYGGTYIIGSEVSYNHSLQERGKTVTLNYCVFAPSYQEGRSVSIAAQILEPLTMINISWNRIKDIFARGYDGVAEVTLSELSNLSLTKGGEPLSAKAVLDLVFKHRVAIKKGVLNQYDQSNGSVVDIKTDGIGIDTYVNMMLTALNLIRDITGVNENTDGSTPKTNTLVGVMEASNRGTNSALAHLYHAYHQIYQKSAVKLAKYNQLRSNDAEILLRQYTIGMSKRPTEVEWNDLYAMLNKYSSVPLEQGGLTPADEVTIRNCINLKQAQYILINRVAKNIEAAHKRNLENIEFNTKQAKEAADAAADAANRKEQFKFEIDKQRIAIEHANEMELQRLKNQGASQTKTIEMEGKTANTIQAGTDSLIKQATKSAYDKEIKQLNSNEVD
jgi:hypothetical protein